MSAGKQDVAFPAVVPIRDRRARLRPRGPPASRRKHRCDGPRFRPPGSAGTRRPPPGTAARGAAL